MEKRDHGKNSFQKRTFFLPLNRREFMKRIGVLGGGIVVYFSYGDPLSLAQLSHSEGSRGFALEDFNAFLAIGANGRITCYTGKIEMGQGVITFLA